MECDENRTQSNARVDMSVLVGLAWLQAVLPAGVKGSSDSKFTILSYDGTKGEREAAAHRRALICTRHQE